MDIKEAIIKRQSVRTFKDISVKEEDLKEIISLASKMPTAYNAQQTTVLYTRDKEKINKIAKLCGNQPQVANCNVFMLLVTDIYKSKYALEKKGYSIKEDLEAIKKTTKIDAGIMAGTINLLATSYGYGCTIIGGVYANESELKKLFNLPEENLIAIGITLGVPTDNYNKDNEKPKFKFEQIAMEDTYNYEISKTSLFEYEKELAAWFEKIGVKQPLHTEVMANLLARKEK